MIPGPGIRGDQNGDLDTGGSAGYANVVVFGPNSEMKYVAPNSSRNGSSMVVALSASHRQAKAAAFATKPAACSSLRAIRSMVAAST